MRSKGIFLSCFALACVLLFLQGCPSSSAPTAPSATQTATSSPTVTLEPTETLSPTGTSTLTLTPTGTSTMTLTPTSTRTSTSTAPPTETFTSTSTLTGTPTTTLTPTATPTASSTSSPTVTSTPTITPSSTATTNPYLYQWTGGFSVPRAVALDTSGNVYVADAGNNRILKFSPDGLGAVTFVWAVGTSGTGNGEFSNPRGIAWDPVEDDVLVADTQNHRIQRFESDGTYISQWGVFGALNEQFSLPRGVAVGPAGQVYVADGQNFRIQKFVYDGYPAMTYFAKVGAFGSGNGQFDYPMHLTVDGSGNLYVTDFQNHRVQRFHDNGTPDTGITFVSTWGLFGSAPGQFSSPWGIALDASGNVLVGDNANHRVQKFSASGTFLSKFGENGTGNGQFAAPCGVAIDGSGNIYVVDSGNNRIQKFTP